MPAKDEADDAEWGGFAVPPSAHVGYYLVDDGRAALEERLGFRPALQSRLARWILEHPSVVYIGSAALLALFVLAGAAIYAAVQGGSALLILLAVAVTLMPALAAAIAFVDWVVTMVVPPRILPKLDLSEPAGGGSHPGCVSNVGRCPRADRQREGRGLTVAPDRAALPAQPLTKTCTSRC